MTEYRTLEQGKNPKIEKIQNPIWASFMGWIWSKYDFFHLLSTNYASMIDF